MAPVAQLSAEEPTTSVVPSAVRAGGLNPHTPICVQLSLPLEAANAYTSGWPDNLHHPTAKADAETDVECTTDCLTVAPVSHARATTSVTTTQGVAPPFSITEGAVCLALHP